MTNLQLASYGEKLKAFIPCQIRDKTRMSILTTLFNIVLKVLATAIREK